ncbi:MAG: DUF2318 domain-containing protein [Synergistaceae bacterium]|jgi:uncharacterized membrane protein|nr:DUF2318 domain-containing protein [Synergistaceae bacterium]
MSWGKAFCRKACKGLGTAAALAIFAAGSAGAVEPESGDLFIPAEEISETARFYSATVDGTTMEVIAVKAPDGTIRTAFNTCQVCYGSGRGWYKQEGSVLVCQNCGNRFRMSDIEVTRGGCNPVPITGKYKVVDEKGITIPADFLLRAKGIFENWKRN